MKGLTISALLLLASASSVALGAQEAAPSTPGRHRIEVRSTSDGSLQPSYVYLPTQRGEPAPLAVLLHTWSFDLEQRDSTVEAEAHARGWILLAPNFRGRNDHPQACGSPAAQQDILDAVSWVRGHYQVDSRRIYLLGLSGGGFMTMLMAAKHPDPWAAASAWVGISDLAAGRFDKVVSVSHTLRAFQALAPGALADAEVDALVSDGPGLPTPTPADTASDTLLGRRIFLRRAAGPSRVTVFDGAHEWVPRAAVAWLANQRKIGR